MSKIKIFVQPLVLLSLFLILVSPVSASGRYQVVDDPSPPADAVKLIFIHHSTGENWLTDGYGNLGRTLAENNYFVSDTNYGWGPGSIGDRTDIPDWLEWFSGDQTTTYMEALFSESGQNSSYTRLFDDPGGENLVIMFKSCFPNSALEGSPDDPPDPEGWLTVGHAKFVYNEILRFFATHPDKFFIVITAPPLSDPTYADNARAFNLWLVNDWLEENAYSLSNVAVFDFYNVLTARTAHHQFIDGAIEHVVKAGNTLAYPSADDHPSKAGSQKATDEFIPLLNVFYHRWIATTPFAPSEATPVTISTPPDSGVPLPPEYVQEIENFESDTSGWEAFWDGSTNSTISCSHDAGTSSQGKASMRIDFSVMPGSWANCSWFFDTPQDWSAGEWLTFDITSDGEGLQFNLIVHGGTPDLVETYVHPLTSPMVDLEDFIPYTSVWTDLVRVEWEADSGSSFEHPEKVIGLAFGFDGLGEDPYNGTVWIDNIHLEKSPVYTMPDNPSKPTLPCLGTILFPFAVLGYLFLVKREKK